ncbi:hypothetical protein [Spiroplasma phoeniceum]|uniref:Uncharacterized protein n=1 Tax=Spiroplasma phoeniceum P40 TaxID=1276259 RepID=A0A345DRV9_9MOLU|nr:hypothetical protein [Spiroplasma phoeniceum]AXF96950.1 hypothetical protein SDAV_002015 [Spiroplasma phoeniceum P40]
MYRLFNMIIQIFRGQNIKTSKEIIPELCYKDDEIELNLRKEQIVLFGFNNHDADHIIYQTFVQSIFPLTEEIEKELEDNYISCYNDPNYMNGIGITFIRGTTKVNDKNLNKRTFDLGNWLKENNLQKYDYLFLGKERQFALEKYSYRKELIERAKFFDPTEFWWKDINKYWFSFIASGSDYADSIQGKDDAVQILVGVEINKNDVLTEIYILEEQSISTTEFKYMTKKVSSMANKVNDWSLKYHKLKEDLKYRIGHDARTVGDFVREKLIINHILRWKKSWK